jgi:hypothetical protein
MESRLREVYRKLGETCDRIMCDQHNNHCSVCEAPFCESHRVSCFPLPFGVDLSALEDQLKVEEADIRTSSDPLSWSSRSRAVLRETLYREITKGVCYNSFCLEHGGVSRSSYGQATVRCPECDRVPQRLRFNI